MDISVIIDALKGIIETVTGLVGGGGEGGFDISAIIATITETLGGIAG